MKNKKTLSLFLLYVFLLTVIPVNLIVEKVKAAEGNSSIPQYLNYSPLYTKLAVQYKDKTVLITKDSQNSDNYGMHLKMMQVENGQEKTLYKETQNDHSLWGYKYMGMYSDQLYMMDNPGVKLASVYTIDTNKGEIKYSSGAMKLLSNQQNYNNAYDYSVGLIDKSGTQWFAGNTFGFSPNYGIDSSTMQSFVLSNNFYYAGNKGASEHIISLTQDNKGNVFALKVEIPKVPSTLPTCKILKIGKDSNGAAYLKEYPLNGFATDIQCDKNGDLYVNEIGGILYKYTIQNDKLVLVKKFTLNDGYPYGVSVDAKGDIWTVSLGKVSKIVNDVLIDKYVVNKEMNNLSVYDDNHLVVYGTPGYTIISNGKVEEPTNPTTGPVQIPVDGTVNQMDNSTAIITVNSSKLDKNAENILTPNVLSGTNVVSVVFDALTIKDGKGSLTIKLPGGDINIPFSTIDLTGISEGAFITVKQTISTGDNIINKLRGIKKVFQFDMTIFDKNCNEIRDIHQFKNGKAKVNIKLTAEDIKGLDVTKLAAFYYNETSKTWENMGGSFDKSSMTFTFETAHFSKFALLEADKTTNLPKTGSPVDMTSLIIAGCLSLLAGCFLLLNKKTVKQ